MKQDHSDGKIARAVVFGGVLFNGRGQPSELGFGQVTGRVRFDLDRQDTDGGISSHAVHPDQVAEEPSKGGQPYAAGRGGRMPAYVRPAVPDETLNHLTVHL